jgi:hypothetical protein
VAVSTYLWRRLDLDGLTFVRLHEGVGNVSVEGVETCADGESRWAARFLVELDAQWRHERTTIEVVDDAGTRHLELATCRRGSWTRDGRDDPTLAGCTDVDLAGNPFTNAFVTRRVAPDVGADVTVRAAYVETPGLSVCPMEQRYERLAADRWAYSDDEYGRFEFGTDADGITIDYEGLAERL